ncbi:hypothetical protein Ahy_A10g048670 [Arachis hypogaea]|uniref:FAR1 domain-containing protein n=1 Tax=Arachis hypogaea TaxID=3818 RepID=A0A445B5L5_ARAHY|nr:hypothetical protein Ahy_A10g048670 [Arachis hypogaea]
MQDIITLNISKNCAKKIGKYHFSTLQLPFDFYLKYLKSKDFSARKSKTFKNSIGEARIHGGEYYTMKKRKKEPRLETRTGCEAQMDVKFVPETGSFASSSSSPPANLVVVTLSLACSSSALFIKSRPQLSSALFIKSRPQLSSALFIKSRPHLSSSLSVSGGPHQCCSSTSSESSERFCGLSSPSLTVSASVPLLPQTLELLLVESGNFGEMVVVVVLVKN